MTNKILQKCVNLLNLRILFIVVLFKCSLKCETNRSVL